MCLPKRKSKIKPLVNRKISLLPFAKPVMLIQTAIKATFAEWQKIEISFLGFLEQPWKHNLIVQLD